MWHFYRIEWILWWWWWWNLIKKFSVAHTHKHIFTDMNVENNISIVTVAINKSKSFKFMSIASLCRNHTFLFFFFCAEHMHFNLWDLNYINFSHFQLKIQLLQTYIYIWNLINMTMTSFYIRKQSSLFSNSHTHTHTNTLNENFR